MDTNSLHTWFRRTDAPVTRSPQLDDYSAVLTDADGWAWINHGLGFANVLTDLGLPQGALLLALVGFNLGVEVGQLAMVGVFLPLAYRIRHSWLYQRLTLQLGSLLIVILAAIWLVERSFDLRVLG